MCAIFSKVWELERFQKANWPSLSLKVITLVTGQAKNHVQALFVHLIHVRHAPQYLSDCVCTVSVTGSRYRLRSNDTADYGLHTADYGLHTADYGLHTADYGLPRTTLCLKKTPPTFLAVTRAGVVGF